MFVGSFPTCITVDALVWLLDAAVSDVNILEVSDRILGVTLTKTREKYFYKIY